MIILIKFETNLKKYMQELQDIYHVEYTYISIMY